MVKGKIFKKTVSLFLGCFLAISSIQQVRAEIPKAYWKYQQPFLNAVEAKNDTEIIRLGTEIMNVFKDKPIDKDKAGILYSTYDAMYPVYEKQGNYDKVIAVLKAQIPYGEYLGFKDGVKLAKARAKRIDPMTEVYALTQNTSSVPYFGMKNEPKNGTYFGRVFTKDGAVPMESETAISFYIECFQENIRDYDYLIRNYADGKRIIHIALNMPNENDSLKKVVTNDADSYLRDTMAYINSLNTPVLLRIGGEMNVWQNLAEPSLFKQAFVKIANIARTNAPNVALVFSPNDISNWNVDIDDYYPGDSYVDWVGVSLYTNKFRSYQNPVAGKDFEEMYYGNGIYANPISKLRDIVDRYGDRKPIIITEGGSGHSIRGGSTDLTGFASNQINMLYTYVNMVFPQVKGIVYFDVDLNKNGYVYAFNKNTTVFSKYQSATENNMAFIRNNGTSPYAYVKASNYSDNLSTVELYTYCAPVGVATVAVGYTLDGKVLPSQTGSIPYKCVINSDSISMGAHDLKVTVKSGGYSRIKEYSMNKMETGMITIKEK